MEAALQLATHPIGRAYSESRIAVDDCYIWPFDRPQMVAPGAIAERMVEDIAALVNDGGDAPCVTLDDLRRTGWLQTQVDAHGARAFALYEAAHRSPARRDTGNRSTVRKPSLAREAACLALLAIPIGLWARAMLAGLV